MRYFEGWLAAVTLQPGSANPYEWGTEPWLAWRYGYAAGRKVEEVKA